MVIAFHQPTTLDEAARLGAELGPGAWFLGGGTILNSIAPPAGERQHLVSLARLGLDSVEVVGSELRIGAAMTLQQMVEAAVSEPVRRACLLVNNRTIRNQATLGGHVAAAQRQSALLPMLVALDARLDVHGPAGPTTVPLASWLAGERRDLIAAVRVPAAPRRAATAEHRRSANDHALLTVAAALELADGSVRAPALVVGGLMPLPQRLAAVEERLAGRPLPAREELERMVTDAVAASELPRASAAFQRYLAGVLVAACLVAAAAEVRP